MNILLVDDHPLFRVGIRLLVAELGEGVNCVETADCAAAFALPDATRFALVLLDLHMPGMSGMTALHAVRAHFEEATIVVLSGDEDPATIRAAIEAGASGYIPKSSSPALMLSALRLVLDGGSYLPPHMLPLLAGEMPAVSDAGRKPPDGEPLLAQMTERQLQTLRLAMQGKPNKVIARDMSISEATVKAHLAIAFRVLGVRNRTEAVFVAARMGLPLQKD